MSPPPIIISFALIGSAVPCIAQPESLANDEHYIMGDMGDDPTPDMNVYEGMNKVLGGDSIRMCAGYPCLGWVEDRYSDGALKHRGYYDAGQLTIYKNYWPNGSLEREFRSMDAVRSLLRMYHSNGNLRSETRYLNGTSVQYEDHYVDGTLRYAEERHRHEPYYLRMDLFAADGHPVSTLQLVDKKKVEFIQKEYHPGGALRCEGRARYDPSRMNTQRIGSWTYFDEKGTVTKREDYQDGRLATVR